MYCSGMDILASAVKENQKTRNCRSIISRKDGGSNRPENLVTLCKHCHQEYHKGNVELPDRILKPASFADAAFMGIMRKTLLKRAQTEFGPIPVEETFGYLTRAERIKHGLDKEHYIDARCISGHPEARSVQTVFFSRKVRCHNGRFINSILQRRNRKLNQSARLLKDSGFDKSGTRKRSVLSFGKRASGASISDV